MQLPLLSQRPTSLTLYVRTETSTSLGSCTVTMSTTSLKAGDLLPYTTRVRAPRSRWLTTT